MGEKYEELEGHEAAGFEISGGPRGTLRGQIRYQGSRGEMFVEAWGQPDAGLTGTL